MRLRSILPLLWLLLPGMAAAQDELELFQTDRPDLTEGAARVGRGAWQLETGWSFATGDGFTVHSLGDALLRIGVHPNVELRLFAPSLQWNSVTGARRARLGDVGAGAKIGISSADDSRAVALLIAASEPLREAAEPRQTREAVLAVDLELPAGFGAGVNTGMRWEDSGIGETSSFRFATLSVGRDVSKRASLFLEFIGERITDGDDGSSWMDGGGSFAVVRGLQLDGSVGRALESDGDWFGGLGISKRW